MYLIRECRRVLNDLGGYRNIFYRLLREATVRTGVLVGTDKYNNKYFENSSYMFGRNRFVEFPYKGRTEFDGSEISPEWHSWMHYMTDEPPTTHPPVAHRFIQDHVVNKSGTKEAYVPYSTTKPKIEAWVPK